MNETDVRKCIKNGHAWSSCGDNPEPTPTRDYTRGQLATYEGLHATKHEAQAAIDANNLAAHAETPAEKDARIKALVDGYKAKGGPITKEQLTDEVMLWLKDHNGRWYQAVDPLQGFGGFYAEPDWIVSQKAFWNKPDAEHVKWLADMQSQTTPITPEQAKLLREGDSWCYYNPVIKSISECVKLTAINADQGFGRYFTRAAAQAALDKAKDKAKHKPCDMPDEITFNGAGYRRLADNEQHKDGDIPVDGSQTHRFGSIWYRPVKSHETPVGETQAKEVVTDDTRCKICMGVIGAIHAAACSAGADMLDEQDEKRLHELFDRQEKETVAKSDEQDPEPVKWLERKSDEHVQKGDDITWNRSVGINDACAFQHAHDGWTPLTSDPDKFPEPVGYEYTGLTLRSRYLTPEWKAWKARQDAKASNKEPVAPVEVTPTNESESAKSSNKPTTLRGWLETIPDAVIRESALRQLFARVASNQASSLPMALSSAFDWRLSDEGFDFWNTCRSASIGEKSWPAYPFKDRQEADGQTQVEIDKAVFKPVGNKYHRTIHGVTGGSLVVDVYNVLDAFGVTCPACQHAIKKLLCAGLRNKGSRLQDLTEAEVSVKRAVELEQQRKEGEK